MRLSPVDPEKGIALSGIGMSFLMLERFDEALRWGRAGAARDAQLRLLAPGRDRSAGRPAAAGQKRAAARRLLDAFPTYNLTLQRQINPWRDQAFGERYLEALRVAGIPE